MQVTWPAFDPLVPWRISRIHTWHVWWCGQTCLHTLTGRRVRWCVCVGWGGRWQPPPVFVYLCSFLLREADLSPVTSSEKCHRLPQEEVGQEDGKSFFFQGCEGMKGWVPFSLRAGVPFSPLLSSDDSLANEPVPRASPMKSTNYGRGLGPQEEKNFQTENKVDISRFNVEISKIDVKKGNIFWIKPKFCNWCQREVSQNFEK